MAASWGFNTAPLDKQFYTAFKALRKKYKLVGDKNLLECLVWFALTKEGKMDVDLLGETLDEIAGRYKNTAPSDTILPEVQG